MATNIFVQFDKIEGECEEEYHKKWCEITSFGQTFENAAPPLGPKEEDKSNSRRGKHGDIKISKVMDKASIGLMEACWEGRAVPEVVIECFRAGLGEKPGQPIKYFNIKLKKVIIKKFKYGVSEGNLVSEELELVAAEAVYKYRLMDKLEGKVASKLAGLAKIKLGPADFCDSKVKIGPRPKTEEQIIADTLASTGSQPGRGRP
jgi:type VI secretion system Hcp family effector